MVTMAWVYTHMDVSPMHVTQHGRVRVRLTQHGHVTYAGIASARVYTPAGRAGSSGFERHWGCIRHGMAKCCIASL